MTIFFGADHAGFELKNTLIEFVRSLGHEAEDCGAFEYDAGDDYPDFVLEAARRLAERAAKGEESAAIVIGASGQGEAMAANRVKGVRCALYYGAPGGTQTDMSGKDLGMLESVRAHNDANALSLGARFLSEDEAKEAVAHWLAAPRANEERHLRRIEKLDAPAH